MGDGWVGRGGYMTMVWRFCVGFSKFFLFYANGKERLKNYGKLSISLSGYVNEPITFFPLRLSTVPLAEWL